MVWIGVIGVLVAVVIGGLALARDVYDYRRVADPGRSTPPPGPSTGRTDPPATSAAPTALPATYLSTLPAELGGGSVTALPKGMPGPSTYARAVSIRCPGRGQTTEVGFGLRGDFMALRATVRASFPVPSDKALVTAFTVVRETDGTPTKRQVAQHAVPGTAAAALATDLDRADQLLIQVRCESADGVVVLDDGRLTRAP
jgi:hypothetical protein